MGEQISLDVKPETKENTTILQADIQVFLFNGKNCSKCKAKQVHALSMLCNPQMRVLFLYETMNSVQKKNELINEVEYFF